MLKLFLYEDDDDGCDAPPKKLVAQLTQAEPAQRLWMFLKPRGAFLLGMSNTVRMMLAIKIGELGSLAGFAIFTM